MKKHLLGALCAGVWTLAVPTTADAVLESRLGGLAYYDTVLDITWVADANINDAQEQGIQSAWAAGLSLGGFDDWRLPNMDVNGDEVVVACNFINEVACRDNEYGYLFYYNGVTPSTPDPFSGVVGWYYWSGTPYVPTPGNFREFAFHSGNNATDPGFVLHYAMAVRDGDVGSAVPSPVPATSVMARFTLIGLLFALPAWLGCWKSKAAGRLGY